LVRSNKLTLLIRSQTPFHWATGLACFTYLCSLGDGQASGHRVCWAWCRNMLVPRLSAPTH
jgi:hypothetical protein